MTDCAGMTVVRCLGRTNPPRACVLICEETERALGGAWIRELNRPPDPARDPASSLLGFLHFFRLVRLRDLLLASLVRVDLFLVL